MKILLEFTTINYKMWHGLAKRLQEIYPQSRFAGVVGFSPDAPHVLDFLKNQKDVTYEFLELNHEITAKAFASEIDREALRRFEEKLPQKSLWRAIAADRDLGSAFVHDAVWRKTFINQNNSYENILRVFSGKLRELQRIFDDFQPDLFLPALAMGDVSVFIYEHLCRERNIPYLLPCNVRVKNYFAYATDVQLRFPLIDATCRRLWKDPANYDFQEAAALYDNLMAELPSPVYFDRINQRFDIVKFQSWGAKCKWLGSFIKASIKEMVDWQKSRRFRRSSDVRRQPDSFRTLLSNISCRCQFVLQKLRVTHPRFTADFDPQQKYIYYPLHINPEYSTQVQGTMWVDQVHLIELLAKSIPSDWKVYVKEHPGTLVARIRPWSFHKRIQALPNVQLLPIDADMHTIISHAQMVAVITGTAGWEAILRGKPVITFADNIWDVIELSRKCPNVETLSNDIYDEVERIKAIPVQERKKRIVSLLAAILEHSFELSYPNQFAYTEPGTDEEYEILGRETAEGLVKHLSDLQKEKSDEQTFVLQNS